MPRHSRIELSGAVYHVIVRGIERRKIFLDDLDRKEFIRRLVDALCKTKNICYGWVLMPNHFHLLIRQGSHSLSEMMRKLSTGYAVYFNRRHKRSGYLYQNRYKSILCQEDAYMLELVRYIHLNPLRAKLVVDMNGLNRYPWSGHQALIGIKNGWQSIDDVLVMFSSKKSEAVRQYKIFISDGIAMGKRDDLSGGGLRRSAGGWEQVKELRLKKEYWRGDERILGDGSFVEKILKQSEEDFEHREKLKRGGWNINKLITHVCEITGVSIEDLQKKGRRNDVSKAKALIAYVGRRELRLQGTHIAKALGISRQAVSLLFSQGRELGKENTNILTS